MRKRPCKRWTLISFLGLDKFLTNLLHSLAISIAGFLANFYFGFYCTLSNIKQRFWTMECQPLRAPSASCQSAENENLALKIIYRWLLCNSNVYKLLWFPLLTQWSILLMLDIRTGDKIRSIRTDFDKNIPQKHYSWTWKRLGVVALSVYGCTV